MNPQDLTNSNRSNQTDVLMANQSAQTRQYRPILGVMQPPDDILADDSLPHRTYWCSSGLVRLVISLGRLTQYHSLVIPGTHASYVESIGEMLLDGVPSEHISAALSVSHRVVCEATGNQVLGQILFEHGNSGDRSISRYGTHIAHMHSLCIANHNDFSHAIRQSLVEDKSWVRVSGWRELSDLARDEIEYCFIQLSPKEAWCREVTSHDNLPKQYLRRLVYYCLQETGHALLPSNWLWRSAGDMQDAVSEATTLRRLSSDDSIVHATRR